MSTVTDATAADVDPLPRWSTTDVFESLDSAAFRAAMERVSADVARLTAVFDEHGIRATEPSARHRRRRSRGRRGDRAPTTAPPTNSTSSARPSTPRSPPTHATSARVRCSANSRSTTRRCGRCSPDSPTGSTRSARAARRGQRAGARPPRAVAPTRRAFRPPDERGRGRALRRAADHRLVGLVPAPPATSRRSSPPTVEFPDGRTERLPMPAVRGLATSPDPAVRRGRLRAELAAWPTIATPVAAAINAIKGEANAVNRRRGWVDPLDASLFANSVSRATFDAMHAAVVASLPDFRRWMRTKARSTATRAGCAGGTWWRRSRRWRARSHGTTASHGCAGPSRPTATTSPASSTGRSTNGGSTPGPATARSAARSACVRRRPVAGAAQLVRLDRLGPDHRARARPRLPQHHARRTHAAPEAAADGARRDGEHLLRDARRRGGPRPARRHRAARAARRRPQSVRQPGGRRHPLALPVRDRAVRAPPARTLGAPS
jgi:hypothetical protein